MVCLLHHKLEGNVLVSIRAEKTLFAVGALWFVHGNVAEHPATFRVDPDESKSLVAARKGIWNLRATASNRYCSKDASHKLHKTFLLSQLAGFGRYKVVSDLLDGEERIKIVEGAR